MQHAKPNGTDTAYAVGIVSYEALVTEPYMYAENAGPDRGVFLFIILECSRAASTPSSMSEPAVITHLTCARRSDCKLASQKSKQRIGTTLHSPSVTHSPARLPSAPAPPEGIHHASPRRSGLTSQCLPPPKASRGVARVPTTLTRSEALARRAHCSTRGALVRSKHRQQRSNARTKRGASRRRATTTQGARSAEGIYSASGSISAPWLASRKSSSL